MLHPIKFSTVRLIEKVSDTCEWSVMFGLSSRETGLEAIEAMRYLFLEINLHSEN